ncbi:vWA domain-containing protein [Paenibacillus pinistramenti]|uniref:vWA domain-containing protein n=1 Tax=Paenibacillus pinistramenti TaxID=1768003 RepID=UPI001108B754|nr:VWA domain-containing protein [Paenibacillus pinistramenti]
MNQVISFNYAWNKGYYPAGGAESAYLLIELQGSGKDKGHARSPINLSVVLDRSGSMSGDPLMYSKKACQFVAEQMNGSDLLSLVAFDDHVQTVIPPSAVLNKDLIKQHIESIQAGGTTNLSGGLAEGAQHVLRNRQEGRINRVILLSDGHANTGITDRSQLNAIAKEYRSSGIGISTIGVGDGFDEELMEGIAEHGGGNFYYIDKADGIPGVFEQELEGLLSVAAQNIKLTCSPSEGTQIVGIYGYPSEGNGEQSLIQMGDIYHNEVKTLLVELSFDPRAAGEHQVLQLSWDYIDVTESAAACSFSMEVSASFTTDISLLNEPGSAEVEQQVGVTKSAKVIEEAIKAFDTGNTEEGKHLLKIQADELLLMSVVMNSPMLAEESAKLYTHLDNFEYSSRKRKELNQEKYRRMKRKS